MTIRKRGETVEEKKIFNYLLLGLLVWLAITFLFLNPKSKEKETKRGRIQNKQELSFNYHVRGIKENDEKITIETPLYIAKISKLNGNIVYFYDKKYKTLLIPKKVEKLGIFPLSLYGKDELEGKLISASFSWNGTSKVSVKNQEVKLHLVATVNGTKITRTYTFYPDNYAIGFEVNAPNRKFFLVLPEISNFQSVAVKVNGKVKRLKEEKTFSSADWVGVESKYYTETIKGNEKVSGAILNVDNVKVVAVEAGKGILYFGPKEIELLEKFSMEDSINFGIMGFLAKYLLKFFLVLHNYVPNWGLVIVILTLIVKVILHPLTHKGVASMKKMQELAPKLEELKKRYKNNPQKLNEEVMKLYKEAGVNPMGGCLPILLQIPIFIALYEIFMNAVELKGASFLWIADLSSKDPTYILPILMGISMIVQQKLSPSSNPEQQRVFYLMAIVFTIMFANFPAGLVLYWLTNNVISAIQNFIIMEMIKNKP